ncbi:hypothetical protein ES708_15810 [subsurface metagenome]
MINHQQNHYDRYWGWQPIKARKLEVLEFIYDREVVTAYDLINRFGYTYGSARCRLCQLRKEGFIQRTMMGHWCLTDRGYNKLDYHGVLKRKEDEEKRIKRQAEGRMWVIDNGRMRTAKNVDEALLTFNEALKALKIIRELRKEGLA